LLTITERGDIEKSVPHIGLTSFRLPIYPARGASPKEER